jgi:ADP-ribosylglycohydrolase
MRRISAIFLSISLLSTFATSVLADHKQLVLTRAEYEDKIQAAWLAQIIGVLVTLPFEHKVSSVLPLNTYPVKYSKAIVDDDWYYEMIAVQGFEKFGPGMTVNQLGELWQKHNCGTWGSSKYALAAMHKGIKPEAAGLPQNNPLWFTIGPMFSCELYGLLSPGDPNQAGKLARELGSINGYAEGLDAGVFSAAVVSLGFSEKDPKQIVIQAAQLIHPDSPVRQAIDIVIKMGEAGHKFHEVCDSIEDRWHIEYPATNNAVANCAILGACIWFGEGDFLKSMSLAASAGDFIDADNIAAVSCTVVATMRGTSALPADLIQQLNDRIQGTKLGSLTITPAVDESISNLAQRTAVIGWKNMLVNGATLTDTKATIPCKEVVTQTSQVFRLSDLTTYWNKDWKLERAGFGGGNGVEDRESIALVARCNICRGPKPDP